MPTFRGLDGLWRNYNPQDLATPEAFAQNPTLIWEWYDWRPNLKPHLTTLPPLCEECGQLLRPGVVWFGENLPPMTWEASVEAISTTDILLVIGTSGLVYPAAQLVPFARQSGAKIVEINLEPTAVSPLADATLIGPSGQILPKLVQ